MAKEYRISMEALATMPREFTKKACRTQATISTLTWDLKKEYRKSMGWGRIHTAFKRAGKSLHI